MFLLLIPFEGSLTDTKDIVRLIIWIVIGCYAGYSILHNYRFKKKIDNLNTPNELLSLFKKNSKIEIILGSAAWLLFIIDSIVEGYLKLTIELVAAFLFVMFLTFNSSGIFFAEIRRL